jgi:hypothetical protein
MDYKEINKMMCVPILPDEPEEELPFVHNDVGGDFDSDYEEYYDLGCVRYIGEYGLEDEDYWGDSYSIDEDDD